MARHPLKESPAEQVREHAMAGSGAAAAAVAELGATQLSAILLAKLLLPPHQELAPTVRLQY